MAPSGEGQFSEIGQLEGKGLKYTEQRWKIAELILSTGGH